jgi:hypothetical protein
MFGEERIKKFVNEFVHYQEFQDVDEQDTEIKPTNA